MTFPRFCMLHRHGLCRPRMPESFRASTYSIIVRYSASSGRPRSKCLSHKPDRLFPVTDQIVKRHNSSFFGHISRPSSALPHRLVTQSNARQIEEASCPTSIQATGGPNSRRQSSPTPPVGVWRDAVRRGHFGATQYKRDDDNDDDQGLLLIN